jgi:uncharacterized membrane protein YvlD (DUF360 family)
VIGYISFAAAVILVRGITASNPAAILAAVALVGLTNAFIRPVFLALIQPFGFLAIAVFGTLLQVAVFFAVGLLPGIDVVDATAAVEGAVIFSVVNIIVSWLVAVRDEESYFGHLIRLLIREHAGAVPDDGLGVVFLQIDGLSDPILLHQVRAGRVPTMSRWIRSGSHRLTPWECQLPSQTSASQAGILHGANDGIPAFRWYEKSIGRLFVSNRPADAAEVEARISNGHGLLADGGTSIGNVFSGDASENILTISRLEGPGGPTRALGPSRSWVYFFSSPFAFARALFLSLGEAGKEVWQARRQAAQGIEPRIQRGGWYPLARAATNVLLRQVTIALIIERMLRGVRVIYADLEDYDEIAHHAGPERGESLDALDGVDAVLRSLEEAAIDAPRPYRFVVLSDHGQSQGATFRQRYGVTIEQAIHALMRVGPDGRIPTAQAQPSSAGGRLEAAAATGTVEPWGALNTFLTELGLSAGWVARLVRRTFRGRSREGFVELGPGRGEVWSGKPDLVVCASGNLALAYFNVSAERVTLEELDALHPGMILTLAAHPGIGFVMVRSREHGPVAIGDLGRHYLSPDRVEGVDPLLPFGPLAADDLRRLDAMPNVGDLVLNSRVDPETEEVAAFEELVGSHGGLGGWQTDAFVLHPSEWPVPETPLIGAPALFPIFVDWLEAAGIRKTAGAAAAGSQPATTAPEESAPETTPVAAA